MNFYVPEIGDEIILSEDWSFELHAESRNNALGAYFGYYMFYHYMDGYKSYEHWVHEETHPIDQGKPVMMRMDHKDPNYEAVWKNHQKDLNTWVQSLNPVDSIPVTLKKGTTLKIDRIYIRKGVRDYSSITFYAKNLGEVTFNGRFEGASKRKAKAFRFWAKLDECNKIIFDK